MTQHLFKNSFLRGVLFLLLCAVGLGNAWGEKYKLITSTSELVAGEKYIIASMKDGNGYVMKNYESGNNWKSVEATASSSTITYAEGMAQLTLGGTDGKWTFNNGTYYIDATSTTSSNYLKGSKDIDEYNKFSISFSNKAAVITCTGKDSRNILRYNSQSNLFACYSSGQLPVYLYKKIDEPEQTKTVTSLSISETPNNTTYYVGEEPSAEGLKVTATYSDNTTNVVTSSVSWSYTPATITSGTKYFTATASYEGKEATSEPFNITIKSIANTAESAYTVAQACTLIDAGKGLSEEVYVKGIVSQVDEFKEKFGSITYWISEDGTTTGQQFQCYGGLNIGGEKFTSIDDLKLGTAVVVKGLLTKYNNTIYELNTDNVLIFKDESNVKTLSSIEIGGEPAKTSYYIGDTPSAEGLTVNAVYSNGSKADVTDDVTWTFNPETIAEGTKQVTATAMYKELTATYNFRITQQDYPPIYELIPVEGGTNAYDGAGTTGIAINGVTWFVTGNSHMLPWRIGGKSLTNVDRDIKSSTPINGTFGKVVVSVGTTSGSIDFNRLTLSVADNPDFTDETNYEYTGNLKANTKYTFDITPATNAYYKITFNVTVTSTSNKYYEFSGAKFYRTDNVEISSAGLATFCLPYNATIPNGLTAYTATDNGKSVKLTAKEGGKIAAGEGVVLKGDGGTYTFVAAEGSVSATAGNQMVGVTEDTELTEADNAYMLTRKIDDGKIDDGSIAFRLLKTNYTLEANKAYLKVDGSANTRELIPALWDDNATGIDNIAKDEATATGAIYNLAGQKLMRAQKGINIINGKLVIK